MGGPEYGNTGIRIDKESAKGEKENGIYSPGEGSGKNETVIRPPSSVTLNGRIKGAGCTKIPRSRIASREGPSIFEGGDLKERYVFNWSVITNNQKEIPGGRTVYRLSSMGKKPHQGKH